MWNPRVGGEKSGDCPRNVFSSGSPPRGRGKEDKKTRLLSNFRITPAWAGKSIGGWCLILAMWDHPRVGGEKEIRNRHDAPQQDHPRVGGEKIRREGTTGTMQGSPPRGRGKDSG